MRSLQYIRKRTTTHAPRKLLKCKAQLYMWLPPSTCLLVVLEVHGRNKKLFSILNLSGANTANTDSCFRLMALRNLGKHNPKWSTKSKSFWNPADDLPNQSQSTALPRLDRAKPRYVKTQQVMSWHFIIQSTSIKSGTVYLIYCHGLPILKIRGLQWLFCLQDLLVKIHEFSFHSFCQTLSSLAHRSCAASYMYGVRKLADGISTSCRGWWESQPAEKLQSCITANAFQLTISLRSGPISSINQPQNV